MKEKESELVTKIAEAQVKRNAIFADIESLRANETKADEEIARLKAELAEEKKPELRHGDYGITEGGYGVIDVGNGVDSVGYIENGDTYAVGKEQNGTYALDGSSRLGNIFDDLKAMSKPLTSFEMEESLDPTYNLRVKKVQGKVNLQVRRNEEFWTFRFAGNEFHDFILKLRRLEATPRSKK